MIGVAYTFTFLNKHSYDTTRIGVTVPVELVNGSNVVQVDAKLDTGASFCIFERTYGEMLGLDVEGGEPETVSTANGTFQVFGHWLTMTALGFQFEAMVYFAADEGIRRSVLRWSKASLLRLGKTPEMSRPLIFRNVASE